MLLKDVQVTAMLEKSTFAGLGGEWQTTSECDFSGQGERFHHVQKVE